MTTAAEIQRALLPPGRREGECFDAVAEMMPCRQIGGDFFGYIDLPDNGFGFALGDVAGKGPKAALLGAMLQGSLAAKAFTSVGPAATIAAVNTALVLGLFDGTPFEEGSVVLELGDFLVTFSDGVSEAMDLSGEKFGDERLLESIASMTESGAAPRLKHIFQASPRSRLAPRRTTT